MRNFDLSYNKYSSYERVSQLGRKACEYIDKMKVDDNFYNCNWNGFNFSVKPFLCSAMSFVSCDDVFTRFVKAIIAEDKDIFDRLSKSCEDDSWYYKGFNEEETDVYESILCEFDSHIPSLLRYIFTFNTSNVYKVLVSILLKEFSSIATQGVYYIDFYDKDICNTQAFSYYISMYWALKCNKQIEMHYFMHFSKEIKSINFNELLSKLCPKESIHYKYLSGEITSKELKKLYNGDEDNIGIVHRETINLGGSGTIGYDDSLESLARLVTDRPDCKEDFDSFYATIGSGFISLNFYKSLKDEFDELRKNNDELIERLNTSSNEVKELKSSLKSKNKELSSISEEYEKLQNRSNSEVFDKRVSSLEDTISELNCLVARLRSEIKLKDEEILKNKKLIRSQIKKLKSYEASHVNQTEEIEEIIEEFSEVEEVSIEEMASSLKGYKIGVFGGFDCGNMEGKFKEYGLDVVHIVEGDNFKVGKLDFAVVLISNILHKTLRRLESQFDGEAIYCSGSNVENIIRDIYKKMKEKEC